jgi:hypothetical protein
MWIRCDNSTLVNLDIVQTVKASQVVAGIWRVNLTWYAGGTYAEGQYNTEAEAVAAAEGLVSGVK